MEKLFLNKVVVVTGSGSGIGKATAMQFAMQGAKVMLNGRTESKLKKTADEFLNSGYDVEFFAGDVTDYETCKQLVAFTIKTFGTIHVLVANGSISMNARFDKMDPGLFKAVLNSNIYGAAMPLFAALDILKQTRGSVIFIGSMAGFYGMPTASAYCAGKMALTALQQSLRIELHSYGVHVGIVYAGFTVNDPEKTLMAANGEWKPVPDRPRIFQQNQNTVAETIVSMARFRTHKKVLSVVAKSTNLLAKFAPWTITYLAIATQKRIVE